jgi:hypothetical protein
MKLTITEIHNCDVMDFITVYRYDCFLDDTFVMFGTWSTQQKFSDIVEYFVREIDKDWARVKQRLGKKNITKLHLVCLNQRQYVMWRLRTLTYSKRNNRSNKIKKYTRRFLIWR